MPVSPGPHENTPSAIFFPAAGWVIIPGKDLYLSLTETGQLVILPDTVSQADNPAFA